MKVFRKFSFLKTFLLFVILLSTDAFLHAQVVYEPLYEDVYNFLGRVSQKGIIEFDDLIRPLPRKYISDKLLEADSLSSQLTSLERDELEFFLERFLPRTMAE